MTSTHKYIGKSNIMNHKSCLFFGIFWLISTLFSIQTLSAQKDCQLNFNGDWSYEKGFDAFKGFTSEHGNTKRDSIHGLVTLSIADVLNGNPDPLSEQIATYQYICENQDFIRSVLLDSSKVYFTEYFEMLEGEEWLTEKERADLEKMDLIQLMSPQRLHILKEHKNGYAYYGLGGHCVWELDEGFGFLLHKNKIIAADVIFVAHETHPATIDNGTFKKPQTLSQLGRKIPPMPSLHLPHPKYGKLKPTEERMNIRYVYDLIRYGYVEEVKKLYNQDMIVLQRSNYNLVQAAARYNQLDLLKFFLTQKPKDSSGLLHEAARNKNKEMVQFLLEQGQDINEVVYVTPLDCIQRKYIDTLNTTFPIDDKEFTNWMRTIGAKTIQEIVHENIKAENGEKLRSIFENNHSLQKDDYIKFALEADKPKMAEIIFSTHRPRDAFLIKKAADLKSKTLLNYCLKQGYDINVNVHWNKKEPKTALNRVQERIQKSSGDDQKELQILEEWMINHGALTSEELEINQK